MLERYKNISEATRGKSRRLAVGNHTQANMDGGPQNQRKSRSAEKHRLMDILLQDAAHDEVPETEFLPQAMTSPPPFNGWGELEQIPFRRGGNDPFQAQMRLSGSDERVIRVIDDLRTQLLRTLQSEVWNRIAITAPTSGCGTTFTACNLALSISRIPDFRTVLMDLNQRNPGIAQALNLKGKTEIHRFLSGIVAAEDHILKYSDTLALALNTARPKNPSELLHSRQTADVLDDMIATINPDIVLYDLPPMLEYDDLSAFLPQIDGVLLVADATKTLGRQIEECERRLAGKTPLLGVILNRTRKPSEGALAA